MPVLNEDELAQIKQHIQLELVPICEADPNVLSDYIIALLRHDMDLANLKCFCKEQLEDFLRENTIPFVDGLFSVLADKTHKTMKEQRLVKQRECISSSRTPKISGSNASINTESSRSSEINPGPQISVVPDSEKSLHYKKLTMQASRGGNIKPSYPNAAQAAASLTNVSTSNTSDVSIDKSLWNTNEISGPCEGVDADISRSKFVSSSFSQETSHRNYNQSPRPVFGKPEDFKKSAEQPKLQMDLHYDDFMDCDNSSRTNDRGRKIFNSCRTRQGNCYEFYEKGTCSRGLNCFYEHLERGDNNSNHGNRYDITSTQHLRDSPVFQQDLNLTLGRGKSGRRNSRSADKSLNSRLSFYRAPDGARLSGTLEATHFPFYQRGGETNQRKHQKNSSVIVVENLPEESCAVSPLQTYFSRFGSILDIKVYPQEKRATLQYSSVEEATLAYSSSEPIFENRFIRVGFFQPKVTIGEFLSKTENSGTFSSIIMNQPSTDVTRAANIGKRPFSLRDLGGHVNHSQLSQGQFDNQYFPASSYYENGLLRHQPIAPGMYLAPNIHRYDGSALFESPRVAEIGRKQVDMLNSLKETLKMVLEKSLAPNLPETVVLEYKNAKSRLETQIGIISESIRQQPKTDEEALKKIAERRKREQLDRELDIISSQIHQAVQEDSFSNGDRTSSLDMNKENECLETGSSTTKSNMQAYSSLSASSSDSTEVSAAGKAGPLIRRTAAGYFAPNPYVLRNNSNAVIGRDAISGSRFNIDLRPTKVEIFGIDDSKKCEVALEFANFGEIESTEYVPTEQIGNYNIVLKYVTRSQAEKAVHFGPKVAQRVVNGENDNATSHILVRWRN